LNGDFSSSFLVSILEALSLSDDVIGAVLLTSLGVCSLVVDMAVVDNVNVNN
jgi:hypothetical protein